MATDTPIVLYPDSRGRVTLNVVTDGDTADHYVATVYPECWSGE